MSRAELEHGRALYARREWAEAYDALARADRAGPLASEDLELFATVAYMLGRDEEQRRALERAHQGYLDRGDRLRAVRCAFWLGVHLAIGGERAHATGWFSRARRLLEREPQDCVEQGYGLMAHELALVGAAEWEAASSAAAAAAELAERYDDAELLALALMDLGRSLVRLGRVDDGLARLDEAMIAATTRELSPIVTGLVYCSVIAGCHEVQELRRAQEWTASLSQWCAEQPGLVPFTGTCLLHRAELMQLHGEWAAALDETRLALERFERRSNELASGEASYRQGEVLRLQGRLDEAEQAYRAAAVRGFEPEPGLALLRLAQGRAAAAAAAIERALAGTTEWVERARLLPACVEIMVAVRDRRPRPERLLGARGNRPGPRERDARRTGCPGAWARRACRRRLPRRTGRAAAGAAPVARARSAL